MLQVIEMLGRCVVSVGVWRRVLGRLGEWAEWAGEGRFCSALYFFLFGPGNECARLSMVWVYVCLFVWCDGGCGRIVHVGAEMSVHPSAQVQVFGWVITLFFLVV